MEMQALQILTFIAKQTLNTGTKLAMDMIYTLSTALFIPSGNPNFPEDHHRRSQTSQHAWLLTSIWLRLVVVAMASERLAPRLTGDTLPGLPNGDSNPESMLDSELLELRLRVSGSSIVELYVQGDCDMDIPRLLAAAEGNGGMENGGMEGGS